MPNYAFFEGSIVPYSEAKVGMLNQTLNYGTGAFGGLRAYYNDEEDQLFVFRPRDHYRRFLNSARLLAMELPYSADDLVSVTLELIRTEGYRQDVYVRPLAYNADEIIGVRLHDLQNRVSIVSFPFGRYVENDEGAHVTFSSWHRVTDNAIPARGKIAGAYVNSAFIKTDAVRAGFDEALVLDQHGHLTEGSAENFFMLRDGVVVTPPITDDILEGITRRTIMTLIRDELGMDVVERTIDRTEVYLADEALFCGTGVQIAAITRVDHRPIGSGKMGDFVAELRELYFNVVRGRLARYREWNTPVYLAEMEPVH
ncbi:MAG: branched-chain amino acid transaminase [Chloroflexi bacterium]|nr:branched-chain amino acid transaminase [Chloroflexota bacterium]